MKPEELEKLKEQEEALSLKIDDVQEQIEALEKKMGKLVEDRLEINKQIAAGGSNAYR